MMKAQIMVAQDPRALAVTQQALQNYDLLIATDIQVAEHLVLEKSIDLFVIGIHFDDSRAIDLVNFIREIEKHKATPMILVRFLPTSMQSMLRMTVLALVRIGSVSQYIELEGDVDFVQKIKDAVIPLLPPAKAIIR